jgi:ribosomal subunit interface protein
MRFSVTGRHVDVSEAFRLGVETGLTDFYEKYQVEPLDTLVTLSKESFLFQIEIKAHLAKNVDIIATAKHEDAYSALSSGLDLLGTRLRRHKKRVVDHHKRHDTHANKEPGSYYILNGSILNSQEEDITGEELAPAIVAEISTHIPSLSVGDAVMRMDLSEANAFVFRNSMNKRINFVYRRVDGNIGWMDPSTA